MLRFLSVIRHESPRYNHAFTEKAQHLRRWIPLRMFTRGRLVPHQPRAIKRTTRTELHRYNIHIGRYVHRNTGITLTALHGCNIYKGGCIHWNAGIKPMMLRSHNIRNGEYIHRNISVTPIALYGCNIPIDGYIYWNIGTKPTAVLHYNIPLADISNGIPP